MTTIRQTLLLRPMQNGVSGFARMQQERSGMLVQLHARGLPQGEAHLYWYLSGQAAREVAAGQVNRKGEASFTAEAPADAVAPERLQALILTTGGEDPKPLLIGLCAEMSAGSLLDAKNAALALCERLRKKPEPPPAVRPVEAEIPTPPPRGKPAGRLRPLRFPEGFESLQPYFEKEKPVNLLGLPGWRFVPAASGLWVGILPQDGRVKRVAYAYLNPPVPGPYRAQRGLDGQTYHVLWQSL